MISTKFSFIPLTLHPRNQHRSTHAKSLAYFVQTDMCNPTDAIASKNGVDTFVRQNLKSTQEVSLLTTYNLRRGYMSMLLIIWSNECLVTKTLHYYHIIRLFMRTHRGIFFMFIESGVSGLLSHLR